MLRLLRLLYPLFTRCFHSRRDLLLENLVLRQQLAVFKEKRPLPKLAMADKLFWVPMCRLWSGWKRVLLFVQPETVVRWHRTGFKLHWKWLSRHRGCAGRKCVSSEFARTDLSHGCREPNLGCSAHTWRTDDARLRHLGKNGFKVDAKGAEEPGACETVESLLEQPPRSHRRHGLLHRPNADL